MKHWTGTKRAAIFFSIGILAAMSISVRANFPPPCDDSVSYGSWECLLTGTLTNTARLNFTNAGVCAGQTIPIPTGTNLTYSTGLARRTVSHSCPEYYFLNGYATNTVTYTPVLYFSPTIPLTNVAGTYYYTGLVYGVASPGGACPTTAVSNIGVYVVSIFSKTTITSPLTNKTVCPGSTVVFSVGAVGTAPLGYSWKFGTNVLAGQTNNTLSISNVNVANAGLYTVIVSGSCGAATNSATLSVNTSLTVSGPSDLSVCAGSTAVLGVTAFGTGPFTYSWKRGTNTMVGQVGPVLTITNVNATNVGTYTVTVIGACGTVAKTASLRILSIAAQPANQVITYGQSATFSVLATGADSISYQWRKNGTNVLGANSSSYTVVLPSVADSGSVYSVVVSSPDCSLVSSNATLTVNSLPPPPTAPTIVTNPISLTVIEGASAAFTVSAVGTAPLTYQWQLGGTNIAGATNTSFVRASAQPSHAGNYTVVVSNAYGTATSSVATLIVVGVSRLILDGSNPEVSSAASNLVGTTYVIRAIPSPVTAGFTSGQPVWTIQSQPAGSGLNTNLGTGWTTQVTATNAGQYIIRAQCGTSFALFSILSAGLDDSDYDGITDQQEILDHTDPNDPNSGATYLLGAWKFDSTAWGGVQGQGPRTFTNLLSVRGVNGQSVVVGTNETKNAWLIYNERETNGAIANFNCRQGSVSFWFKPNWNSGATNGSGPTNDARLIEMGSKGSASEGCWGLYLGARGTNIYFCTQTNSTATPTTNFQWGVNWTSNNWRFVVLTYCATNSKLYLDGGLVITNGAGVTNWPGIGTRTNGFCVGSSRGGTNQALGRFDNLTTYSGQLAEAAIQYEQATTCFNGMDVMMVMDVSGSMAGTKIADAKAAATNFVSRLDFTEDKAGVAAFSDAPVIPLPRLLTNTLAPVISAITNLSANGYTRIDRGLTNGMGELLSIRRSEGALPVMVLLSDGSNNISGMTAADLALYNSNTLAAATTAKATNAIRIVSIALGSDSDTNLMRQIATPGLYYYADQSDQLSNIFAQVTSLLCRNQTNPPYVTIISPTNSQKLQRSFAYPIRAVAGPAKDLVGVRFYAGSLYLGLVTSGLSTTNGAAEYVYHDWIPQAAGTYTLTAVATNLMGLSATSFVQVVVGSGPPTITIITPENNASQDALADIRLTSIAEDDGTVTNVTYYNVLTGAQIGSSTRPPYRVNLTGLHAGTNVFRAEATDDDGNVGISQLVTNFIRPRVPLVTIATPRSNDTFAVGGNVPIQAIAWDIDGIITNVQFKVGSTVIGTIPTGVASNMFTGVWTNALASNPTNVVVTVWDNDGLTNMTNVLIYVGGCSAADVSAVTLSTNEILGGSEVAATVTLSTNATAGGQFISLGSSSSFASVPPFVFVPYGTNAVSFTISTLPVGVVTQAVVTASYHGQPGVGATLTINPRTDGSENVISYCGPMDVAFLIDTTGSMSDELEDVKRGVTNLLKRIESASGGDYRLSLVTFDAYANNCTGESANGEFVCVVTQFADTNRDDFISSLLGLTIGNGDTGPEASDEALNTVIKGRLAADAGLNTANAPLQYGDFAHFRSDARKIVVLVTDAPPGGADGQFDDVLATQVAQDAKTAGILISPILIGANGDAERVMTNYAAVSGGIYVQTFDPTQITPSIDSIIAQCGGVEGGIVSVRDDITRSYTGVTIQNPQIGARAAETSLFDTRGVFGSVTDARMERNGRLTTSSGSRYDIELGVVATNGLASSFGQLFVNAQTLGAAYYHAEWELPNHMLPALQAQLDGACALRLTNSVSSVCGSTYNVTDKPHDGWPTNKNILTFVSKMDRFVPAGRCRSFILVGTNQPLNGTWDVMFRGQVIASSGNANGWDVESDYTVYGGFTVTVPTNAAIDLGYEVRVRQADWLEGRSARFQVLPGNSISSAPVLLPLVLSTNGVGTNGGPVTLTVSLDTLAPAGDAYVTLTASGPSAGAVPAWVIIPAGQYTTSVNVNVGNGTPGDLRIMASYNGYRKAKVRRDIGCNGNAPGAPQNFTALGTNGMILLNWSTVSGATSYSLSRSNAGSGSYVAIFSGLVTNYFVDTAVVPPNTYYYRLTALSNTCASTAASTYTNLPYSGATPAPWIIPAGGTFHERVVVLLTNYLAGTTNLYTTNGALPTLDSAGVLNGGTLIFSNNVSLWAFSTNVNFQEASRFVSSTFTVVPATPLNCDQTNTAALSTGTPWSTVSGPGYYSVRFALTNKVAGEDVDVLVTSTNFDTVAFLLDPSGRIVAANDDLSPSNSNSRIHFTLGTNGVHTVEVTSYDQQQVGNFNISLGCPPPQPAIHAYTNGTELANYDILDFGVVTSATKQVTLVLSNLGLGTLNVTSVKAYPPSTFGVSASSLSPITGGGAGSVTISFTNGLSGIWTGLLVLTNNTPGENPFYLNLRGEAVPPSGPPVVSVAFPTNGTALTGSPWDIQLYATAYDADGITNVSFYLITNAGAYTFLGAVTNAPYTNMWTNVQAGAYQLVAKAWDAKGYSSTSSVVSLTVGNPTLVLAPSNSCVGLSNTPFTVTATFKNAAGTPLVGSNVIFSVQGAHTITTNVTTIAGGIATFTYTGTNAGADWITARATNNGAAVLASAIVRSWAKPVVCGSTTTGALAITDGYSIGCQCTAPTRYSDFYSISNASGTALTLTMTSTNFSTYLFVLSQGCVTNALTNEVLNATDVQARFTMPSNGTYIIEATSYEQFQTGGYKLTVGCNVGTNAPEIAVLSPTNIPSYTLLDLGTTNNGATLSRSITITNRGGTPLVISNYFFTLPSVFSITPSPATNLLPGAAAAFTVQFTTTNSGQYTGSLVMTNNDSDENPFVLNLTAISNPNGAPPVVGMTTPTNGTRIIMPGSAEILASAIPVGTDVTITNVDFVFQNAQGTFFISSDTIYPYTAAWSAPLPGNYTLFAVAKDSSGRTAIATNPVTVQFYPSSQNQPPRATNDTPVVLANSVDNTLDVLANDRDPDGDALTIINVTTPASGVPAQIIGNGKFIRYTPPRNIQGGDSFYYEVSDGKGGTASAYVAVAIAGAPLPQVEITYPPTDGYTYSNGTIVPITATITNNPFITQVEFYQNGVLLGVVTNATSGTNFILNWLALVGTCNCGITATAIDKFGQMNTSGPRHITVTNASTAVPVARLDNLAGELNVVSQRPYIAFTNLATVRDGLFDLQGAAYTVGSASDKSWQVLLYDAEGEFVRNLTPGPLDATGFRAGEKGSATTTEVLATCDFTALENGVYELILRTKGGYRVVEQRVRFRLEAELKIGQFSFSEQDMVIPANGIPLTVTRTYNSMDLKKGSFGYSWKYAVSDMQIELYDEREESEDIVSGEEFSLRVGGYRDVTLTLPGGRRATFTFDWEPAQCGNGQWGSFCLEPVWKAPPGMPGVSLRAMGEHIFNPILNRWNKDAQMDPEWYEFPGYILTLEDGTEFHIQRDVINDDGFFVFSGNAGDLSAMPYGPPYLARIVLPSKDRIEIGRDGYGANGNLGFRIQHYNATNAPTRAVVFQKDAEGRIVAISDPAGQNANGDPVGYSVVKYEYDAGGNLSKVMKLVDRTAGTYITNQYFYENGAFPHFITRIVDARGYSVTRNLYDDGGKLIGMIDANGRTNRFEHDLVNKREIQYDKLGQATVFQYDAKGKVLAKMDALGHTNGFVYNADGYMESKTDGMGNTTTYVNDGSGNVLSMTLPHPAGANVADYTASFTYDDRGNRTSLRMPTGGTTTNIYDAAGRLLTVMNDNGPISSTAYNDLGLPVTYSDGFGSMGYKFDAMGNLAQMTNNHGGVMTSVFDANGNLTNMVDGTMTSSLTYDALNRQTSADYGNNISVNYGHAGAGDGEWSSVSGPTLGSMQRTMDNQGHLAGWTTANNAHPGFAYDANGRMEYETNSAGVVTRTTYDAAGRMTTVSNLTTGISGSFGYDAANRRTMEVNALGHVTGYSYNEDNSMATMTNELGRVWFYAYETGGACCGGGTAAGTATDPLGRQETALTSAYGLPVSTIWRSAANVSSNYIEYLATVTSGEQEADDYPVAITDEGGRTRRYDYAELGQLSRATDMSGAMWWTNQFDNTSGAITNVAGPSGESLGYSYDTLGNLKAIRFGDGNCLTNFYNSENRLNGVRLPSGMLLTNFYDFAGRVTNRQAKVGATVTENASFEFNEYNGVTVMRDNTGSTTNVYDAAGRLQGILYPSGASARYGFDVLGRLTSLTNRASAAGTAYVTRYGYDATGSITNVIDPFNGVTSLEYDRVGRRTKRILPNNVVTEWQYDWRDRVTNLVHKTTAGTVLASFGYVRNTGGEPSKIVREGGTNYVMLKYDAALRLTNEMYYINGVNGAGGVLEEEVSYGYDASGARTRWVKGGQTLTNGVSGAYQITQVKNGATVVDQLAYDTGGRVTQLSNTVRNLKLTYNLADQVASVTNGGTWVSYEHDASGRRTFSTNSASMARRFLVAPVVDGELECVHLVANAAGTVQQGYVFLGDDPILRYDPAGNATYYLEDAMGSVAALANGSGTKVASFNYDGFGNIRSLTGTTNAPAGTGGDFRFHGAWFEEGSGLYNMRAREYDPRMGRFTSRDQVGGDFKAPETLNVYQYGLNNPFVARDPSGQFSVIEINIAGALQSGMQGFRAAAVQYAKQKIKREIADFASQFIGQQIMNLLGGNIGNDLKLFMGTVGAITDGLEAGNLFGAFAFRAFCGGLDQIGAGDEIKDLIHRNMRISAAWTPTMIYPGMPLTNGRSCRGRNKPNRTGWSVGVPYAIPDFIIGDKPILDKRPGFVSFGEAFTVGDFKWSLKALHDDYASKTPRKPNQWVAITAYAKKHAITRTALFVVFHNKKGMLGGAVTTSEKNAILSKMAGTLIGDGVIPLVVVLID